MHVPITHMYVPMSVCVPVPVPVPVPVQRVLQLKHGAALKRVCFRARTFFG